jgi:molybdate transport system permease protein
MLGLTEFEIATLFLSLKVAVVSVLVCLPFGLGAAWLLARKKFFGKVVIDALFHLPLVVPPVVVGYLLLLLFGRSGLVGSLLYEQFNVSIAFTWKGAAIAAAVMAFPLMVRAMRLSLEAVDRRLEAAARTLGATRLRVFATITLPLMAPGILVGIVLAFARALGEFGATIAFVSNIPGETQTLPLALYSLAQTPEGETGAIRLALIAVAVALIALIISEWLAKRISQRHGTS